MVFIYFVYGLSGALIGSFLNVCILRIPEGRTFLTGRSRCPVCGHVLAFYDMVPILSWLLLKGRCRHCGAPVSRQYPAVELLTASAFILCLKAEGPGIGSALMCIFACLLITAAFIDARHMYIPDGIHILILALSCISLAAGTGPGLLNRLGGRLFPGRRFSGLCKSVKPRRRWLGRCKAPCCQRSAAWRCAGHDSPSHGLCHSRSLVRRSPYARKNQPENTDSHGPVFCCVLNDMRALVLPAVPVVYGLFPVMAAVCLRFRVSCPHNNGTLRFRSDIPLHPGRPRRWNGRVCG